MSFLFIPWDFALILAFLILIVPWRGAERMKKLLAKPELTSRDRLRLYASTIVLQWLLVAVIAAVCARRSVDPLELGLVGGDPFRIAWLTVLLASILCVNQVFGLRKITRLPEEKRGSLFAISEKIMPRDGGEIAVFAVLACTAGLSEEFIYRGFAYMTFVRMTVNHAPPVWIAAILSSVWFSVAHLYQGRRGLITTFVVGMIFVCTRIWTGSLIPAVIAHAAMDLTIGICVSSFLRTT